VVSVARDITESLRAATLTRARDAAESANRAKSEFLSSMSHELRTPLNAVLGYAQLMEANLDAPPKVQRDRLSHIQVAGWHLLSLINDVLDLSRIEVDRIELRPETLPVAALLDPCVSFATNACAQRGLRLDVAQLPDGLHARVDPLRFKQIVTNLLSNATKFNSPGGTVGLRAARQGDHVRVEVSDTGRGLAPTQLGKLYEPFNRLGAEGSNIEGAGIGLVITKRLVEVMGGRIEVESTVGEGSRFTVVFPAAEAG